MNKKIQLLHIAQSAGYGVTVYVDSLISSLGNTEFDQSLLCSLYYSNKEYGDNIKNLICIPMNRNIAFSDLKTIIQCRKIIKQLMPNIVYCHSAKAGIYGRLACLGTSIKVVYNPHGWAFNMKCSSLKKLFYIIVESIFAFMTDIIITISDYERKTTPRTIPFSKLKVIKNGIDVNRCRTILRSNKLSRKQFGIPDDAFVVGIIARISFQKGQDMFVDIAKKVKSVIPNAYFVIVGGKSDDIDIESLINKNGLDRCFLITGEVQDAIRYASLFDVAVLTSRWEGFGLVLLEYMVAQKPIVAFNIDAIPEIIKNESNGLLIEPFNLDAFASGIIKLYHDISFAGELANSGYDIVATSFDIKRVTNEHESLFYNLLNKNAGGKIN